MRIAQPIRIRRTYTQQLNASPEKVFPLLCPVRERDWVPGWKPSLVISESGVAEPECVFTTSDKGSEAVWVVTLWDPENYTIKFVKVTPGITVGRIFIQLTPVARGTAAEITYMHTALSNEGRAFVESFTEEFFVEFMKEWEAAMNHYLDTGEIIA